MLSCSTTHFTEMGILPFSCQLLQTRGPRTSVTYEDKARRIDHPASTIFLLFSKTYFMSCYRPFVESCISIQELRQFRKVIHSPPQTAERDPNESPHTSVWHQVPHICLASSTTHPFLFNKDWIVSLLSHGPTKALLFPHALEFASELNKNQSLYQHIWISFLSVSN